MTTDDVVEIHRHLATTPVRVWRALTDADELALWFWPARFETVATTEPVVGGDWRIASAPVGIAVAGRYLLVRPPAPAQPGELSFDWRWDGEEAVTVVRIRLTAIDPLDGGGTALDLTHSGLVGDAVGSHRDGWESCLDRLPEHLARIDD